MESLGSRSIRRRDREREREKHRKTTIFKNALSQMYTCVCSMNTLYTSPRRTDRSTTVLQCSLKSSTLTPKFNGLPVSAPNRPFYASVCVPGLTDRSQPIRSSTCSADPADVELVSQHMHFGKKTETRESPVLLDEVRRDDCHTGKLGRLLETTMRLWEV